jgi:hypothetical protein
MSFAEEVARRDAIPGIVEQRQLWKRISLG